MRAERGEASGVGHSEEGIRTFSDTALPAPKRVHSKLTCSVTLSKFNHLQCLLPEKQSALYLLLSRILPLTHEYEPTLPTCLSGTINPW